MRGLVINRVSNALFVRSGPQSLGRNVIEGNIIGLDPSGDFMPPVGGVASSTMTVATSAENTIGGAAPQARNLLAGLTLRLGADYNSVWGNYIGTRADGMGRLSASLKGQGLTIDGSAGNLILDNVISGNSGDGVSVSGTSRLNPNSKGV